MVEKFYSVDFSAILKKLKKREKETRRSILHAETAKKAFILREHLKFVRQHRAVVEQFLLLQK